MPVDHRSIYLSILRLRGLLIKDIHINKILRKENNCKIEGVVILRVQLLSSVQGITPSFCPQHKIKLKDR